MGPLLKIWTAFESARLSQEDSVEVDLKKIQEFVEQTVMLGQASNSISCCRRLYMLLTLTNSPPQSKQMLREDSEILLKNDKNLFGKRLSENIRYTSKSKKETLKCYQIHLQQNKKSFITAFHRH